MATLALPLRPRAIGLLTLLAAIYALAGFCALRGAPFPGFTIALTFDLTATAAVATWWLGVRGGFLSRRAPFVVLAIGAVTARLLLSINASGLALGLGLGLEVAALAVVTVRARRVVRRLRQDAAQPLILRLASAFEDAGLPRWLARVLTTEVSTVGLALTGWFRRAPRAGYSVHRTHSSLAIHVVLGLLIALETVALHLLIARATLVGAWISTGLSIYAVIWLVGDAHALRLGRVRIERDAVVVEIARRWAAIIPRGAILEARLQTVLPDGAVNLAIETPTVVLALSAPVTARGPFGLTRTGTLVGLTIDDAAGFVAALAPGGASPAL